MTLRTRLSLWYGVVLFFSLLLIGAGAYNELGERFRRGRPERAARHALAETGELVVGFGVPALILGVAGGWWLTRRALAPIAALSDAARKVNERNLGEQISRSNNGDELDQLTGVFNAMTVRLNDSFTRVRDFTLHASHELKTPLTIMRSEAETAVQDPLLSESERERWANLLDELRRLSRIVDALTFLAKADAGQLAVAQEPVRLDEVVRENFADAQILAEPHDLKVELGECDEVTVKGDRHRLRQLLLNLIDNAVKYNQPAGWLSMSLRKTGAAAEFLISNTGPGIPPESLPRVFDRFYRCDPAHSHEVEGCGLGLSIAQWIVSVHKGEIHIDSVPSKLTTVTVRLPLMRT